jgi:hypothetical protein
MAGWLEQVHTPSGCFHTNARERKDNILESNIQVVFNKMGVSQIGVPQDLLIEKD